MNDSYDFDPANETVDCEGDRVVAGMEVKLLSMPEKYLGGYPQEEVDLKLGAVGKTVKVAGVGNDGYAWFSLMVEVEPGMKLGCDLALNSRHFRVVTN